MIPALLAMLDDEDAWLEAQEAAVAESGLSEGELFFYVVFQKQPI